MITYTNVRNNSGCIYANKPEQRTVAHAVESLLIYELGYGGRVIEWSPVKLVIQTTILGSVDTVTFEGSEEDMTLLVEAAYLATEYNPMKRGALKEYQDAAVDHIMRVTGGKPLYVTMACGILLGEPAVKATVIDMIRCEDEAVIVQLMKFSSKELLPVMLLVRQDGVSVADALALAKAKPMFGADGKISGLVAA